MRLILYLFLALSAAPAWAAWVEVGGKIDEVIFYIDPATIRKDSNLRRVWAIEDLKQRHKDGEMSRRALYEYDCKEERVRILSGTEHSDPMPAEMCSPAAASQLDGTTSPPERLAKR